MGGHLANAVYASDAVPRHLRSLAAYIAHRVRENPKAGRVGYFYEQHRKTADALGIRAIDAIQHAADDRWIGSLIGEARDIRREAQGRDRATDS